MEYEVVKNDAVLLPVFGFENQEGLRLFTSVDRDPAGGTNLARRDITRAGYIPGNLLAEGMLFINCTMLTLSPRRIQFGERTALAVQILISWVANPPAVISPKIFRDWYGRCWNGILVPSTAKFDDCENWINPIGIPGTCFAKQQRTWGWPAVVNLTLGGSGAGLYLLGTFFSKLEQPWPVETQLIAYQILAPAIVCLGFLPCPSKPESLCVPTACSAI